MPGRLPQARRAWLWPKVHYLPAMGAVIFYEPYYMISPSPDLLHRLTFAAVGDPANEPGMGTPL